MTRHTRSAGQANQPSSGLEHIPTSSSSSYAISTSVDHPKLVQSDAESIRIFLRLYDQYVNELTARARQLISSESTTTSEPVRAVNLKFCVDAEWLESCIFLGLIDNISSVAELTDETLRKYLESKAEECKERLTLETLDIIVQKELQMEMSDRSAKSRMESLFVSYISLVRRNGLSWITENNQKVAVYHVLSAVKPRRLRERLESDLEFAQYSLRKDFKGFMQHAIRLSDAFELLDLGPKGKRNNHAPVSRFNTGRVNNKIASSGIPITNKEKDKTGTKSSRFQENVRKAPFCPFHLCKKEMKRHWIDDCPESTNEEKAIMKQEIATRKNNQGDRHRNDPNASRMVGRIRGTSKSTNDEKACCSVAISDGLASIETTGRCDDGSDDSLVSPDLAERAAFKGIGKITKIATVKLQVALKKGNEPQSFTFSRTWTAPRTILHLASGNMALVNVTYLVADDELACEELLIGRPVLKHLKVDTKTLLENNRAVLDGADCSHVGNPTVSDSGGFVNRIMVARFNRARDPEDHGQRPRANYYIARAEEDPFPDPALLDPIDADQHEKIRWAVKELIISARNNGLQSENVSHLEKITENHVNIFRTSLSAGPPANVPPLKIELQRDAKPTRVRLRNYSQEQQTFLKEFVSSLVENGMAYPNPTSPWACAPLLVPKPGPAKFRFTVDLRPINRFTVKHQFPMPILSHELTKLAGSKHFANFDLSHGYWQFPLEKNCQDTQSFITPSGIYTPTRVLHGTTNAVAHLQASLTTIVPCDIQDNVLIWLDDILIHAKTIEELLRCIDCFFVMCSKNNIRLHPAKCVLYANSIRWCGRLISSEGVRYDPRRLDALLSMEHPLTGAHLQQFLCALQWVRNGIPNFTAKINDLQNLMEEVYKKAGSRKSKAVARIKLDVVGWSKKEGTAFEQCKLALANQVTLSHRDEEQRLCIYTDASDFIWAGIVTQVPYPDLILPHEKQSHSPLAFYSGKFNKTQLGWSTLEKEAFAVMATIQKAHWIAATPSGFDLHTDHNNLIFLFDPLSVVPDLSQTTLRKVLRWAVRLSVYAYTCFHIRGTKNVWADLLSRWSNNGTIRRIVQIPLLPSSSADNFEWPTMTEIMQIQHANASSRPENLQKTNGLWVNPNHAIWIPETATDLQLRLCIIAHTGPSGHRGEKATEKILRKNYFWSTLTDDIRSFVRACIHCLSTIGGGKVPRPFGPSTFGTSPNDLLQFDYLEIGKSNSGNKYILMLRDDHSDYCWLFPTPTTSAEHTAHAIIDWCAAFSVPKMFKSDSPTHFKNETLRQVSKGLKVPHHFTLPYSPWSNGAVERLGKEVLRAFRALTSELQMDFKEWPDLVPIIQSVLNNTASPHRANVSPVTAFTGLEPSPPISTFIRSSTSKAISLSTMQQEKSFNISALQKKMKELQAVVYEALKSARQRSRASASKGNLPNFSEGDFVLVARERFHEGEKLALRWRGPRRITKAISDYVFQVEDLRNGSLEDIHATRLKHYSDRALNTDEIMSHIISSERGMQVQRLMKLIDTSNGIKVHVRWKGLSHDNDTLEPLDRVFEDVPKMTLRLLHRKNTPSALRKKSMEFLGI